jgi:hypothetical protein
MFVSTAAFFLVCGLFDKSLMNSLLVPYDDELRIKAEPYMFTAVEHPNFRPWARGARWEVIFERTTGSHNCEERAR